jgi:hypothetical protein
VDLDRWTRGQVDKGTGVGENEVENEALMKCGCWLCGSNEEDEEGGGGVYGMRMPSIIADSHSL